MVGLAAEECWMIVVVGPLVRVEVAGSGCGIGLSVVVAVAFDEQPSLVVWLRGHWLVRKDLAKVP